MKRPAELGIGPGCPDRHPSAPPLPGVAPRLAVIDEPDPVIDPELQETDLAVGLQFSEGNVHDPVLETN